MLQACGYVLLICTYALQFYKAKVALPAFASENPCIEPALPGTFNDVFELLRLNFIV